MTPSIHLTEWGSSGPKIVLIHGSSQGSSVGGDIHFSRQTDLADQGFQLVVPDRPGHGKSPALDRGDDANEDGKWIAELLGDGAHLVGHSFGGACALNAAARRPRSVKSLTLIEPAMFTLAIDDWRVRRFLLKFGVVHLLSFSAAARVKSFAKLMHIPPEIGAARNSAERKRMGEGLARLRIPSRKELTQQLEVIREHKIPLLIVTGGWNPAFTAVGEIVAARGAGAHRIIPCAHHFPQLVSDEFNELLAKIAKT